MNLFLKIVYRVAPPGSQNIYYGRESFVYVLEGAQEKAVQVGREWTWNNLHLRQNYLN